MAANKSAWDPIGKRFGYGMVSETSGDVTTLWAVDLNQVKVDNNGTYVHVYTVTGSADPQLAGTIHLPAINDAAVSGKTGWSAAIHRPLLTVAITSLRMSGDFIWATDFHNGTIYRFKKAEKNGTAEIIFFKPTTRDDKPYQFYDVAFQPKGGTHPQDTLWVADGDHLTTNVYSVVLQDGFSGSYPAALQDITPTPLESTLSSSPVGFFDMVCHNDVLWMIVRDISGSPVAANFGVVYGTINENGDGKLSDAKFIKVVNARTMVQDLSPGKEKLYIGATDGALYMKDITPVGIASAPVVLQEADNLTEHGQMSIDKAGYIWSAIRHTGQVNSYSPLGTLSRQYNVTADLLTPEWTGMVSLHDGKRIAGVDLTSATLGVFTVDEGFSLGDYDLAFDPATISPDVSKPVDTLPLRALTADSTTLYPNLVSATLTEKDSDDNNSRATFVLPEGDESVDIAVNALSVTLNAAVTTGAKAGNAVVTAEGRTTGRQAVTLGVNVRYHDLNIVPDKTDTKNNHASLSSGFDVRQGKTLALPDVKITADSDVCTVEITNDVMTGASFTEHKPDALHHVLERGINRTVPDIEGGNKVGDAHVLVRQNSRASGLVPLHILPLADSVTSSFLNISVNITAALGEINKALVLTTHGHLDLNDKNSIRLPAPKTLVKMTLVSTPADALYFMDKSNKVTSTGFVTRLSDESGEVRFTDGDLQVALDTGKPHFQPEKSHILVEFDRSGQMGGESENVTKASWSGSLTIKIPVND